jgi:2-amino-4-hydroxy-6-hydroxymethyldihydropteridine diphosphokinase
MNFELYIALGSNMGDRRSLIHRAIALIDERIGTVQRVSSFIETEPWGFESEHPFLNAACMVLTALSPEQCLAETQQIERELGRTTKSKNGIYHDRPIDIDLLMYGDLRLSTPTLTLPHPHMQERDFVMIPLREILPSAEERKSLTCFDVRHIIATSSFCRLSLLSKFISLSSHLSPLRQYSCH